MTLLYNHLSGMIPVQTKPAIQPVQDRSQTPFAPLTQAPVTQARVAPVTPAASSAAALLPHSDQSHPQLRTREGHELQALLRKMQGIQTPQPTGEQVDLLVPRPDFDEAAPP